MSKIEFCEHCILGKQHRLAFKSAVCNTRRIFEYVHMNLWGPSKVPTHSGNKYFLSLLDDFSRKFWIYLLNIKDKAFEKFKNWKKNFVEH